MNQRLIFGVLAVLGLLNMVKGSKKIRNLKGENKVLCKGPYFYTIDPPFSAAARVWKTQIRWGSLESKDSSLASILALQQYDDEQNLG